ncbi:hypothetical protein LY78DRAFT_313197 [Colletotrichum sublineola]|nr:hypothetical protein LY78DRAFT_313197 [Colletotrichum sublineola]
MLADRTSWSLRCGVEAHDHLEIRGANHASPQMLAQACLSEEEDNLLAQCAAARWPLTPGVSQPNSINEFSVMTTQIGRDASDDTHSLNSASRLQQASFTRPSQPRRLFTRIRSIVPATRGLHRRRCIAAATSMGPSTAISPTTILYLSKSDEAMSRPGQRRKVSTDRNTAHITRGSDDELAGIKTSRLSNSHTSSDIVEHRYERHTALTTSPAHE